MRKLAVLLSKIYFGLFFRVDLVNIENIPEKGSAVLCANHNGVLDMFFLGYKLKRWIYWMAKEELFRNRIIGAIYLALGAFPVKRGKADIGSIKKAYSLLEEGHIVGIFPQGTRVDPQNNRPVKIKHGAAMLAASADVPVIPVALKGSYRPFSRVRVAFGKPFKLDTEPGKKYTSEELTQFSNSIMEKIIALMEE